MNILPFKQSMIAPSSYMYVCVYVYICKYVCRYMHVCMYVHICMYVCICMHVCMHALPMPGHMNIYMGTSAWAYEYMGTTGGFAQAYEYTGTLRTSAGL